jgi:undecaprenyl-diphosphatase
MVLYLRKFLPDKNHSIKQTFQFYVKLTIAVLPAGIIGYLFEKHIDALLENVIVVGISLIVGGIIFLFLDKFFNKNEHLEEEEEISYQSSFKIGLFQTLAMVPGVSRSAATIIGGVFEGLSKRAAAEFSFFLAVPTMLGATLVKLFKYPGTFGSHEIQLLVIGNIVAFVVAIIAIKTFINFLTRHGFKVFGVYRIIIGAVIIVLYLLGIELAIV